MGMSQLKIDITSSTMQKDVKFDLNLQTHRPVSIQDINETD